MRTHTPRDARMAHAARAHRALDTEARGRIAAHCVAFVPTLSLYEFQPHPSTLVDVAVQQVRIFDQAGGMIQFGTDTGFAEELDTSTELRSLEQAIG